MASTHAHQLEREGILPPSDPVQANNGAIKQPDNLKGDEAGLSKNKLRQTLHSLSKTSAHKRTVSQQQLPNLKQGNLQGQGNQTTKFGFYPGEKELKDNLSLRSTQFATTGMMTSGNFVKTNYKKRTAAVLNLSQTLHINHPNSRFLMQVSNKDANLDTFVNAGYNMVNDGVISNKADRFKFWEANSGQLINKAVKTQMNFLKDDRALDLLQEAMEKSHLRDIKVLEEKQRSLVEELNRAKAQIIHLEKTKSNLQNVFQQISDETTNLTDDTSQTLDNLAREMKHLEKTVENHETSKNRMDKIIEVCKINLIQNEDWLRDLEKYMQNLNNAIQLQIKTNESLEKKGLEVESLCKEVKKDFNINSHNHNQVIHDINNVLADFRNLKSNIYETNSYIQSVVHDRNTEISEVLLGNKKKREDEKMKAASIEQRRKLEEELKAVREQHSKFKKIFEKGKDGEPWESKPEISELLLNLEMKRELGIAILQKKSEINLVKQESQTLKSTVDVNLFNPVFE